jgi:arylsulfatase A-like enzyme
MRILLTLFLMTIVAPGLAAERPNVILIITDDQGYGDIAAHGNPVLNTPNLDKLHGESVRLIDYHVDPTCAPTRAALMSGRYSTRVGVWHTVNGRSMLAGDELTLAEMFKANGYGTAMFGKWHLGENYPCRPNDQGFEHVVWHGGGGVGQGPDYWGNDYFDDTYNVNGTWTPYKGYCTDIWFTEAKKFIQQSEERPFFVYLSTNAPHSPLKVADRYAKPYRDKGVPAGMSKFYGMIENIDENLGKLRAFLKTNGLDQNTLLIFTTDNGTTIGSFDRKSNYKFFNAGMRGIKSTAYEGGTRVPFFMHWPAGKLTAGQDIETLCAHFDVLPTLAELLGLQKPKGKPLDGVSLVPAIRGNAGAMPDRTIVTSVQRKYLPPKWNKSSVKTERWRLVDGKELYDIEKDPGQASDVASSHPDVVAALRADYEKWWASVEPAFGEVVRYHLGGAEDPMTLMSHDVLAEKGYGPWHQLHVKRNELQNWPFMVRVTKPGTYRITAMRWPESVDKPSGVTGAKIVFSGRRGELSVAKNGLDPDGAVHPLDIDLPAGSGALRAVLTRKDGKEFGAYYVKIELIKEAK